ncbi:MAG: DUF3160 domain-containing protein, partial [Polyangiaceae bacterium]|nr:DUF3160 domain-containing protein [Polyangiaceae bacterium]
RKRSRDATERLKALRREVDGFEAGYWKDNLYAEWFGVFRSLSRPPEGVPSVVRSVPWSRRILATQMSAWAEVRHDTSLYLTLSTIHTTCEFPDAYVDPYPDAWKRLAAWVGSVTSVVKAAGVSQQSLSRVRNWSVRAQAILGRIAGIAQTQALGQAISQADLGWMNAIATTDADCDGSVHSTGGWYRDLHIDPDRAVLQAPVVAPVCEIRDPGSRRVLHIGTGDPRAMVVIIDGSPGPRAFVGLVSSYRETTSAQVLDDESWGDLQEPNWLQELFGADRP